MDLIYYQINSLGEYEALYKYEQNKIDPNEIYARQLCDYFVKNGVQYKLISNELEDNKEVLVLENVGHAQFLNGERYYEGHEIHIEFREYRNRFEMPLLFTKILNPNDNPHWHAIRYLLKDYIEIPAIGIRKRDSTEIDEDRKCYVIYVTPEVF